MKKGLKKLIAMASAVMMLGGTVGGLVACGGDPVNSIELTRPSAEDENKVTYNTYTTVMPSNWNELTYEDQNDTQIMNYLASPFIEYDYKFDEAKGGKFKDGKVNYDAIVDDDFVVKYSAVTKIEDVTAEVDAKWGYDAKMIAEGGYAWKVTLREDLKWDDGTAIDASDFVWSMKQQLDPDYQNYRASSYYGAVSILGAKNYVYQGRSGTDATYKYGKGSYEADKATMKFKLSVFQQYYKEATGVSLSAYECLGDEESEYFDTVEKVEAFVKEWDGKPIADCLAADGAMKEALAVLFSAWKSDVVPANYDYLIYMTTVDYVYDEKDFDTVGFFQNGKYEFTVCYNASSEYIKDDGTLSYLAAYELGGFPLVHRAKYEASRQKPASETSLWTSKYNSSLETTASWGPYKLVQFQSGKSYTLAKNEYWYGYKLDEYKDQYKVDKIYCEKLDSTSTQWMAFLGGCVDDIGIDLTHSDDYRNSKYAYVTPGSYTFSWHLYGGLDKLKQSGRNNGILAIHDFRKALSLAIDREDYAAKLTTAYQAGYGYLNECYYYDVVNNGIYRKTDQAKKALLRAYGYTENADGTWSVAGNANIQNKSIDEAIATIKGSNVPLAKTYIEKAYKELTDNAEKYGYDASKKIQIKFGTAADDDSSRREFNLVQEIIDDVTSGTSLEGKVEVVFDASFGSKWSDAFKAGNYELCTSAWGSAAFNPAYILGAYIEPDSAYTANYFDVSTEVITFTMPVTVGEDVEGSKKTLTVLDLYNCLNGNDGATYNWGSGKLDEEKRLELIAALEEYILGQYYSIPTITQFSATLLSPKFSYASDKYNTFMSYGGMQYIRPNYTNLEWYEFVVNQNNRDLSAEYKKTLD